MSLSDVERMVPLYQGMMTSFYDHRAADVVRSATATKRQNQPRYLTDTEKGDPRRLAVPHYWVRESLLKDDLPDWYIAFSDVTSPTNERTLVPVAIPRVGAGHKLPLILRDPSDGVSCCLLACMSSFVADFVARQKLGGTSMTYFYVRQFPMLRPDDFKTPASWNRQQTVATWVNLRVIELVSTAVDMVAIAAVLGLAGAPFRWDPDRRSLIRAELDAAMFHLYGIARDEVDYIMETFTGAKKKDIAAHGEYRTKRMILEVYDQMAEAIENETTYVSSFDAEETR